MPDLFNFTTASLGAVFLYLERMFVKNPKFELLRRLQRQYHRNHRWRLNANGLYVPHLYIETDPNGLSGWDDVGFILNDRRVIVWWRHPRYVYAEALDQQAWDLAGESPEQAELFAGSTPNYVSVGRSRKKVISYTCRRSSAEQLAYYARIDGFRKQLAEAGIDYSVSPTWTRTRLNWADGVELVAPMEVRNELELAQVAKLARKLMLGQTALKQEFPDYVYGRESWLAEQQQAARKAHSHLVAWDKVGNLAGLS